MACSSSSKQQGKVHFILMKESVIEKQVKESIFSKARDSHTGIALPGSLWYLTSSEFNQVNTFPRNNKITLHSAEQEDYELKIIEWHQLIQLSYVEFEMLLAVTTCKERAVVYKSNEGGLLRFATRLYDILHSPQHEALFVEIAVDKDNQERLKGELKYIGPVPGFAGFWFGVEMPRIKRISRSTIGIDYNCCELFSCRSDSTVLVPIIQIICSSDSFGQTRSNYASNALTTNQGDVKPEEVQPMLQIGDRVLLIGSSDNRELGYVRWIGHLPDAPPSTVLTIGVEFDNPIGSGTGSYKGQVLFSAPLKHALFVPADGLMKAIDFYGDQSLVPAAPSDQRHDLNINSTSSPVPSPPSESAFSASNGNEISKFNTVISDGAAIDHQLMPTSLAANELGTDLDIGSVVQVDIPGSASKLFGVIRWMGILRDRDKPFVGVELDEETVAGTDGIFGRTRLFSCAAKHAVFVHLHRVSKDHRFSESSHLLSRTISHAFGSIDCPDIVGNVAPPIYDIEFKLESVLGINRGIQGHQNSCYMDTMLFSMFAYSMAFDSILYRPPRQDDIDRYMDVQSVLRDGIVNPLRRACYVRADKVMELRKLLNECSSTAGLISEEKDPEEFLNSLLDQTLKAEHFLKLSSGHDGYFYQLFMDKDELLSLPTTQHLLAMSFYQADLEFREVPSCLILQMPRFGKGFKMYKRIVPTLRLDITDFLLHGPRPCFNCGQISKIECKDCFKDAAGCDGAEKQFFCEECFQRYHKHPKRMGHQKFRKLEVNSEFSQYTKDGGLLDQNTMPRETMDLFAVVCIHTSHYVAFVKCGDEFESPWIFFDSMADRIGLSNGYNIPKVELCAELPSFLREENQAEILKLSSDKDLSDHMRRLLCDGYICMYQSNTLRNYR